MRLTYVIGCTAVALLAAPVTAQLPTPPMASAPRVADAYLFHGGAGDIFEITSSMVAQRKATDPNVRAFATMLIDHHTNLTDQTLATAKSAGLVPPPPELSPMQKQMIAQLDAAGANFDRLYLQQQLTAHQQALALQSGYAAGGDVAALRANASAAVPVIRSHIEQVQRLSRGAR